MGETIQLGPFMMKWSALVFILSCTAAYFSMKLRLRTEKVIEAEIDKAILNILVNGVMIVVLSWKFAPLLFEPSLLWRNPLSILFLSGSGREMLFGIVVAAVYCVFSLRKQRVPMLLMLDTIPYGVLAGVAVSSSLVWQYGYVTTVPWGISVHNPEMNYHPIHVYRLFVVVPLLVWAWFRSDRLGTGRAFQDLLTFGGLGLMVISFFKPKLVFILYMSLEQIVYLGLIILGNLLPLWARSARNNSKG